MYTLGVAYQVVYAGMPDPPNHSLLWGDLCREPTSPPKQTFVARQLQRDDPLHQIKDQKPHRADDMSRQEFYNIHSDGAIRDQTRNNTTYQESSQNDKGSYRAWDLSQPCKHSRLRSLASEVAASASNCPESQTCSQTPSISQSSQLKY